MSLDNETKALGAHAKSSPAYEPGAPGDQAAGHQISVDLEHGQLHRNLKGRHMQMIAIGGAIGAGLFVGSGGAFQTGGPASVFLGFLIIGIMVYLMMQAVAELSVVYPINGAFTIYICRFVDPSFGWACSLEYAISWLTVLPFEISAACNIIHYWPGSEGITNAAWIVPLLVALVVEFALSLLKVTACVGFIILGIIINCGGVPTDPRGYIGGKYWNDPYSAFLNGFHGFCSVFVTAAFAYTGTELTGLAAAETDNPKKEIPRASNQVAWRIGIFYVVNLLLVGLIVPEDSPLYSGEGSSSRHSPFVIAIQLAGIKVLPSIFNAIILIAVMSVANSCTFGSTRTLQALAANGMAPKFMAYVDKKGRPVPVVIIQLLFGLLAFINLAKNGGDIFTWLLSLSGLAILFIYAGIALAHIRFRAAWLANGHSLSELPYQASCGVWGSWLCFLICVLALIAQFYVALYPIGGPNLDPTTFFQLYLAGPLLIFLYLVWKGYSWFAVPEHRPLFIRTKDIDIYSGMREEQRAIISGSGVLGEQTRSSIDAMEEEKTKRGVKAYIIGAIRNVI
ncbi:uncharacterized protein E0L32_011756 [Thyridium curvatum]|uniref:Amino acid permease/ SLC12A domain-containing protein n=1 Tax=Thyridium curvatum TaxID=1093900 RepID=A0A507B5E9_9PEZI|nr:uncharacterized protein E0L32_011756 [Thyridium curvatum]TPX18345.1 hypothetical protein E0L32_011756 [Thyridium curvatum]